jgi:subtilisin
VADAAAYSQANPGYGFQGDPLRPISGRYYGYLIRAGLY